MIHEFKNFILRGDNILIAHAGRKVDDAYRAINTYIELGVNDRERQALRDISDVIGAYATALQTAAQMSRRGVPAREIDAAVRIDDGAALAALDVLAEELSRARRAAAGQVYAKVGSLNGFALAAALVLGLTQVVVVLGFLLANRKWLVAPMVSLSGAMHELAGGASATAVPGTDRGDELGEMARAVLIFKENMMRNAELTREQEAGQRATERRAQRIEDLIARFDGQVSGVLGAVASATAELESTARRMSSAAEEASGQVTAVATASSEATANVETVAAAAEQMAASIVEIGRQVQQSATKAQNAVAEAETTNETVQGLAEAASRIGDVVRLINDIAGQTNLLALNATIEAARAGEAGKGFAVVAQEVKNLANQTAKATEEISQQILAVQEETNGAVGAIEKIRSIIGEVNDIATTISSAVEQQGVSTQEIARNVQQAAKGTQDVNQNIESVSKAAGETGSAAGQVLNASQEMARQAEGLRSEVERFLKEIRAS